MTQLEVGDAPRARATDPSAAPAPWAGADPAVRNFIDLSEPTRAGLARLPGLDGLRGLAVLGVLAFHAGFDRMVGGYLGVSTFFTLSGFLIGSLLLSESVATGSIGLGHFWGRRFRRLLPASLATLAAVMLLFGPFVATADQRQELGSNVLGALFDVANWQLILTGSSYGELFTAPSPVLHFWSLAIEEQFYLVFPLLLLGLWRLARGRRTVVGAVLAVLVVGFTLEPIVFSMSDDRIYFGTDTRAPELLLGALLAVILSSRSLRRRLALRLFWRATAVTAGVVALAVQLWWWWSLEQSTPWLYRGGFALYALLTSAVIVGAAIPAGPLHAVMSVRWLGWVGSRSYGIYLFHWPIFLAIDQLAPDLSQWAGTVIGVILAFGLADASFRWLERPVQRRRWPVTPGRSVAVAGTAVAVVAALAFLPLPIERTELSTDFEEANDRLAQLGENDRTPPSTIPEAAAPSVAPQPPAPLVMTFGDSSVYGVAIGLASWAQTGGHASSTPGDANLGCPVARFDRIRTALTVPPTPDCLDWPNRWSALVAERQPDIAILTSAVWHVADVRIPGSSTFSSIGTPEVDAFIKSEFLQAVDVLSSKGALVVLVTWPRFGSWARMGNTDGLDASKDPARMDRFNQILAEVAAERPGTARLVDLAGWLGDRSQDRTLRSDGSHFSYDGFTQVSREWFGPALIGAWDEWWHTYRAPTG